MLSMMTANGPRTSWRYRVLTLATLVSILLLTSCAKGPTQLEQIRDEGVLRVVTHIGPASYYSDKDGETGLEYELAKLFAEQLGVDLSVQVVANIAEVNTVVQQGGAHVAAGNIGKTYRPDATLLYGPGYHWVNRQVIYRKSNTRPPNLEALAPEPLHMTPGMVTQASLNRLRKRLAGLRWKIHVGKTDTDLMSMVDLGEISYALVYSNDLALSRETFPDVRAAFNFDEPLPLAWAVKHSDDRSLLEAIQSFFQQISNDGRLADNIELFYGPRGFFDYVDSRAFIRKIRTALPELKPLFKRTAREYELDWRLLAALSYQESHWNKHARSSTGVRGLMMLTRVTARQMDVQDRLDPQQSVDGGARYLVSLMSRLPDRIEEPDRTWLALAAYNVGMGHLEDARVLTQRNGGDPDLWEDVKRHLPLLSQRKWYRQTKHGYARGREPVKYVSRIRKYYNVLLQLNQQPAAPAPQLVDIIEIDSPAL